MWGDEDSLKSLDLRYEHARENLTNVSGGRVEQGVYIVWHVVWVFLFGGLVYYDKRVGMKIEGNSNQYVKNLSTNMYEKPRGSVILGNQGARCNEGPIGTPTQQNAAQHIRSCARLASVPDAKGDVQKTEGVSTVPVNSPYSNSNAA